MQVATAREGVLGHLGVGRDLATTVRSWTKSVLIFTVFMTILSVLFRHPIAEAVGVKQQWAAALGIPAGCLYLLLTLLRGVLQGTGDYRTVGISLIGEQTVRLIIGAGLAAVGFGVTGAYWGTPLSFVVMSLYCMYMIHREVGAPIPGGRAALSLWLHVKRAWAPIAALAVIAVLQNIDIIAAKHRFGTNLASSYSATAVAAKVMIWVAMGAGFYLVPEVSRRRAEGEDPRPVLGRALAIVGVVAVPCLLIFGFESHLLLKLAFGAKRLRAENSLFILGVAFTALSATYLAVQYMLALKQFWFLIVLAAVAVAEPFFLLHASRDPAGFAAVVLAVQAAGALLAFAIALRRGGAPPDRETAAAAAEPVIGAELA
jgi:O-antigen/teichoic acid export membrane protein